MAITNTTITIVFCILFIIGIISGVHYPQSIIIPIISIITLLTRLFVNSTYKKLLLIGIIGLSIGFYYSIARIPVISNIDISKIAPLNKITIIGKVVSEPRLKSEDTLSFTLECNKAIIDKQTKDYTGNILVSIYDKYSKFNNIETGSSIKIKGNLYKPNKATNPYQFNYRKYLEYQNIRSNIFVKWDDYKILNPPKELQYKILNYLSLIKKHIQQVHFEALDKEQAELLGGIILGDRAIPMNKELKQDFINAGLAHILAASGINVALLALAWIFITSRLSLPYNIQIIGGMIIVVIYSMLTGLPPSVLRASIMLEFILIGKLIEKNANMIALILFVAVLLLLYNPFMIIDIGFQLSFITALGLIISIPIFQIHIKTLPHWLAMLVLVPFIAQIWAMPIIMFHFNNFSTYSIVANFFAMPLVAIVTYIGFVSSVISIIPLLGTNISTFIDHIISPILWLLIVFTKYISNLPFSLEHYSINSEIMLIVFYLFIGLILYIMWKEVESWKVTSIFSCILILFFAYNILIPVNKEIKITFFDVGDADSILISTPKNKHILIDGGYRSRNNFNSADWVIKPYLYKKNIKSIDAIILTHPQNDHIGGIPELIEEFKIKNFYDNGAISKNKTYNKLITDIHKKHINYNVLRVKDQIIIEDKIKLNILNPDNKTIKKKDMNQNSIVTQLKYDNFSILLTGDAEKETLKRSNEEIKNITVLKVGHHGSKISLDEECIKTINPEIAIISAGRRKIHPASNILKLLKENNIKTLITEEKGAITITSDGDEYRIKTFLNNFDN